MVLGTALLAGLLSTLVIWVGRFFLYELAGASENLVPVIDRYFSLRILGHPFFILYFSVLSILRGLGRVHVGFGIMALTTGSNIVLSWFFLYVEKTDLIGAAYGTVFANILGCLVGLAILLRDPRLHGVMKKLSASRQHWFHFGKNSWNVFLRTLALSVIFFVATRFASNLGHISLAAHQVLLQLYLLSSYFTDGLATSANILGGSKFVSGKKDELREIFRKLLHLGALVGGVFTIVYGVTGGFVVGLFTRDILVIEACVAVLPLIFLTQIPSSLSFTYDGLMFGLGEFAYLRKHIIIGAVLIFLPLALTFKLYSLMSIWAGFGGHELLPLGPLAKAGQATTLASLRSRFLTVAFLEL